MHNVQTFRHVYGSGGLVKFRRFSGDPGSGGLPEEGAGQFGQERERIRKGKGKRAKSDEEKRRGKAVDRAKGKVMILKNKNKDATLFCCFAKGKGRIWRIWRFSKERFEGRRSGGGVRFRFGGKTGERKGKRKRRQRRFRNSKGGLGFGLWRSKKRASRVRKRRERPWFRHS